MDIKAKLDKLVSDESERLAAENQRRRSFEGQQRRAFDAIRNQLTEIVEAASPVIIKFYAGESFAEIRYGEKGRIETTYEIQPNSVDRFSSSPSPAPGFSVKTTTTYDYVFQHGLDYIEPTVREYILPTTEALLDDLMKRIADAIASNKRNQRE
ncbi:MAG: hypothetical protein WBM14_07350 [Terracidiphilus sp.]